ncbi:MAG: carbohydrate-binding protein [Nitrososphaeraceae archaeon]
MSLISNVIASRERIIHVLVFLVSIIVVVCAFNSVIQYTLGYEPKSNIVKSAQFINSTFNSIRHGFNDSKGYYQIPTTNASNFMSPKFPYQTDIFGIQKLYPTIDNGEEWYMNMSDPLYDPQFDPKVELTYNDEDLSWHVDDSKVRMNVYTSSGYNENKITTYNQKELAKKGYMQSPNDWKNVEMTGYVKYEEGDNDQNFAWYARGGKHTDSEDCEGSAYKGQLFYEGDSRFAKQQWFVSYAFTDERQQVTYPLEDRWVGFKFVVYNLPPLKNGTIFVRMENWINENGDGITWKKIDERIDRGHWGERGEHCDGKPAQIITWGGPIATFRWDNADEVDIKYFSVREIEPPISELENVSLMT